MKILVLNCGSSSVKFQLFEIEHEEILAKGVVERIGSDEAAVRYKLRGRGKEDQVRKIKDHDVAISLVLGILMDPENGVIKDKSEIGGIGHRIVHGGQEFSSSTLITPEVKESVQACVTLAPLHIPSNMKGIEVAEKLLPGVPQVAVFDTAFYQSLPPEAYTYALPYSLCQKHQIRRYGFHGTSHNYVSRKAAKYMDQPVEKLKMITCHLGNGSSITAIDGGRAVETSMGFTPLEGLVMGTRCGDIDPAIITFLALEEDMNMMQIDSLLNKKSGMLGLTEKTNDFREIESEAENGDERCILALDIFCHRIKKYIGSYIAVLGGLDGLVFTAGIGENSHLVRSKVTSGLHNLGISLNPVMNVANAFDIGTGSVKVLVVPTNEELAIARDTRQILASLEHKTEKAISTV